MTEPTGAGSAERVWTTDYGMEVAVRAGTVLRKGDVAIYMHHVVTGDGAASWVSPDAAREIAAALIEAAEEADRHEHP